MGPGELGGAAPELPLVDTAGLTAMVHESLINNSMDRMQLGGKTMTDEELRSLREKRPS